MTVLSVLAVIVIVTFFTAVVYVMIQDVGVLGTLLIWGTSITVTGAIAFLAYSSALG